MQAHFGTNVRQGFHQKMSSPHLGFERAERMFDGLPANAHTVRR